MGRYSLHLLILKSSIHNFCQPPLLASLVRYFWSQCLVEQVVMMIFDKICSTTKKGNQPFASYDILCVHKNTRFRFIKVRGTECKDGSGFESRFNLRKSLGGWSGLTEALCIILGEVLSINSHDGGYKLATRCYISGLRHCYNCQLCQNL